MEKRTIRVHTIILLMLLIPCMCLNALITQVTGNGKWGTSAQDIGGYIGNQFELQVSSPVYGGNGFNLDVYDTNNPLRLKIAPTQTALESIGAKIGEFSLLTSYPSIRLRITHTPLELEYSEGGETLVARVDWELGVLWYADAAQQTAMCLSSRWDGVVSTNSRQIEIQVTGGSEVVDLSSAGLYFRLTPDSVVTRKGVYSSSVVFEVEGL